MRKVSSVSRNATAAGAPRQEVVHGPEDPAIPPGQDGSGTVQSVARALDLFSAIVRAPGSVGVTELSEASGLPVGTVHRLLKALLKKGYVRHDPLTRRYAVGYTAVELAARIREGGGLVSDAEPYLRQLVELTGESANLAVLDAHAAVYVAHVASPRTVRMFTKVGNRAPLHASGTGKILVANLPDEQRETMLRTLPLARHTPMTITDRKALRREFEAVRRLGYALDNGEFEEGVSCIAVPVWDVTEEVVAAVSVSGPASRLTRDRADSLVPRIREIVAGLSRTLGSKHVNPGAEGSVRPPSPKVFSAHG